MGNEKRRSDANSFRVGMNARQELLGNGYLFDSFYMNSKRYNLLYNQILFLTEFLCTFVSLLKEIKFYSFSCRSIYLTL